MITSNVYNRVFFIRANQYGTAFAIDFEGRQYLVTARHLLDDNVEEKQIKYFFNNEWLALNVKVVGFSRGEVDVAVLSTNIQLTPPSFFLEPTSKDIILGQDVYFVGYPYKMWTDAGSALAGRPCPFIKKGTLSSAFNTGDGVQRLFVDAINNEGFSGGPLVFTQPGKNDYRVAGVVSKFRIEYEQVLDEFGEATKMSVAYNTGFLIAYDIKYAIDLIRSNPIGLLI
ncbi:MAG: hypothetical protein CTY16_09895 [Methylobacter sp.]|nr:MAG: hypothetical protein CTY16_09895 [Methylobacter sp.]